MKQKIRKAALDDIPALKALYRNTIMVVNAVDYNTEQVRVWAETCERTDSLAKRIESQFFYVAEWEDGKIVGFASFEEPDYLDMMYVHKDHQRQGIGTRRNPNRFRSKYHCKTIFREIWFSRRSRTNRPG